MLGFLKQIQNLLLRKTNFFAVPVYIAWKECNQSCVESDVKLCLLTGPQHCHLESSLNQVLSLPVAL